MLPDERDFDKIRSTFRWQIPRDYNIALDICDRWALGEPDRVALIHKHEDGRVDRLSYGVLKEKSDRCANAFRAMGIQRGDRVGLLLPQCPQTAISHLATFKLAAIGVPLASLFGVDALEYRLKDAGIKLLVTNQDGLAKIKQIRAALPALETVICIDGPAGDVKGFDDEVYAASPAFQPEPTGPDDPALMIYTSGTTGPPKGALHGHRVLLGHIPGIEIPHEFFPQPSDLIWTPADWAWAGGLLNILLPGLRAGVPVLSYAIRKFDPEIAFGLMEEFQVRNTFIPPTALKIMRQVERPGSRFKLNLRTLGSGGEALGKEIPEWSRAEFGLDINEFYGQTECNLVLSSCSKLGILRAGKIGKPVPGHEVAIIDSHGNEVPRGSLGQIAVKRPDPVMFLEYWNKPDATRDKYIGDWLLTGDQGIMDDDDYVEFVGRDDDVITSAGFRIGPGEIEDCLIGHPAVALAAVVGKPDPERTEIVKAFVVLKPGYHQSDNLAQEITDHVRTRLSAHEYPREVAFVDDMPLTTTGKVIRRHFRAQVRQEAEQAAKT